MASKTQLPSTEQPDPRFHDLDAWPVAEVLQAMWEGQLAAVAAVGPALPLIAAAAEACVERLGRGGRLVYAGAGTSGRIGVQDGAELPPTFNWPEDRLVLLMAGGDIAFTRAVENAEDDVAAGAAAISAHHVSQDDVVIGIAASGSTPFTLSCLNAANAMGACTIAVANSANGAILQVAAHPILVETSSEVIAGSTRMKAGTAQKVVLNLLSSLVMVRLGHVYQGRMVDMLARNEKLRRRAERMVMEITGAELEPVRAALVESGGNVKSAVLVLKGLNGAEAIAALERHGGHLRATLAGLQP
jgi:N-acetylmuramic acid 6-phosphate etherase